MYMTEHGSFHSFAGLHAPPIPMRASSHLLLFSAAAAFSFNFSNTLGPSMVLQRGGRGALVFGFGAPFAPLSLSLSCNASGVNVTLPGLVDSEGIWRVRLPPQPATAPGQACVLAGAAPATQEAFLIDDVLFGDVFVCGGQSNMALGMGEINNSSALIAAAAARPGIRILSPQYSAQNVSQAQFVLEYAINWTSAAANRGNAVAGFSAVCYLTAAALYDEQAGAVPFGLIDTAVGGTMISLWLPPSALGECLPLPFVPGPPWTLSCWYNGMLSPLTFGPSDVTAVLYDQGENDVGEAAWYRCAFPLLVRAWRAALGAPQLPFVYVQLPEYLRLNDTALAELREAQLSVVDSLSGTGMAVTADNGDPLSKDTSIHTLDKTTVAARLAAHLRALVYGADVAHDSPRYASASAAPPAGRALTVTVRLRGGAGGPPLSLVHAPPDADGPHANSSLCPHQWGVEDRSCAWFEVQDSTGAWVNASAALGGDGASVVLTATATADGATANATRNGYADWPVVSFYDTAGLPLQPWTPRAIAAADDE